MTDKLFAVYGGYLKDLSHRAEKVVTDKRQMMALIAEEVNVHQVTEKTKDVRDRPVELIYETDLGFFDYQFLDKKGKK